MSKLTDLIVIFIFVKLSLIKCRYVTNMIRDKLTGKMMMDNLTTDSISNGNISGDNMSRDNDVRFDTNRNKYNNNITV